MDEVDCVVVGAGVVGLAVARALALRGREVLVIEREPRIGSGVSSRNSEVIHAGLYYAPNSLKASLCVQGRAMLYDYLRAYAIPFRQCGKLVVATSETQTDDLTHLRERAHVNGALEVDWADLRELGETYPMLRCVSALSSPMTGIVDSHALMLALLGDTEARGACIAYGAEVISGRVTDRGVVLTCGPGASYDLRARSVVNAAGLDAQGLARSFVDFPADTIPPMHLAKGNYFCLSGRCPFDQLIYPVPPTGGLGIHLTFDLGGSARFGPDVEWTSVQDYAVDPDRRAGFYDAIRRFWPDLPDDSLAPAYSGIRPKLSGEGEAAADFRIDGPRIHKRPGLVNLYGIESPGLTACLAIAEHVCDLLTS